MNSSYSNLFRFFFVCADLIALNLVHIVLMLSLHQIPQKEERAYGLFFLVSNVIWLLSAYCVRLYIENGHPDVYRFTKRTARGFIISMVCIVLFAFIYHFHYSSLFIFPSLF